MTTLHRRYSLSLGLGLFATLATTPVWAAPPEEDAAQADSAVAPDAAESEAAPDADPATPEAEASPMPPPEVTEEANPDPKADEVTEVTDGGPVPPEEPQADPNRPPPQVGDKHSIQYTSLLAPRVNPLGLEERLWIGYQYRLYSKDKAILNGSNLGIFFRPIVSPAIALVGATVQVQPAAVLRLRATYSYVAYFGTFDYFQSFQSPHDDFSDSRLDELSIAGQNYVSTGQQIELEALIQARYKGLVLRNTLVADYNIMKMRGDDDLFFDIRIDALVPNKGWVLVNDTDLVWLHEFKNAKRSALMAGARATVTMPFYKDSVYEPGDVIENPNGPALRVGPNIGYIFYDQPVKRPRFNKPTLLVIPQWNVIHRWRSGRDSAAAYPTLIMAFVFSGQLWGKN